MASTLKTSLLVFWIFYIVFVTCNDVKQKQELRRKYIDYCTSYIEETFKKIKPTQHSVIAPIDFFIIGFTELNINKIQSIANIRVKKLILDYFLDQLEKAEAKTLNDIREGYEENYILSGLWTPNDYCLYEQQNFENTCKGAMTNMGFAMDMSGAEVFRTFYREYIYDEITINKIFPLRKTDIDTYGPFYRNENDTLQRRVDIIKAYMKYFATRFRSVDHDDNERFETPFLFCTNQYNKIEIKY